MCNRITEFTFKRIPLKFERHKRLVRKQLGKAKYDSLTLLSNSQDSMLKRSKSNTSIHSHLHSQAKHIQHLFKIQSHHLLHLLLQWHLATTSSEL